MRRDPAAWAVACTGLAAWAALIAAPLACLYLAPGPPAAGGAQAAVPAGVIVRSFALAGVLATASVALAWAPARLLGTMQRGRTALLALSLAPLLLPRYLLQYAWDLARNPITPLGGIVSSRPELARTVAAVTSSMVLALWYWPLAALLIAQGWRHLDRDVWRAAALDAGGPRRFLSVALPLLAPSLVLAWAMCLVLILSEYATFYLAGMETYGTALAVVYEATGSAGSVARAAWPAAIPAAIVALCLWRRSRQWAYEPSVAWPDGPRRPAGHWTVVLLLLALCLVLPAGLLAASAVAGPPILPSFSGLQMKELGTSALAAAVGAAGAIWIAAAALALDGLGRAGRAAAMLVGPTILLAALLPGNVVGVALVRLQAVLRGAIGFQEGWWSVSAGLAARFAGLALVVLRLGRDVPARHLGELAEVDGASAARAWWHVHLPAIWPLPAGTFLILTMLGITEPPATMVLLPAGTLSFAQSLLEHIHRLHEQQVIASCLVLLAVYAGVACGLAGGAGLVRRRAGRRVGRAAAMALLIGAALPGLTGCGSRPGGPGQPKVVGVFGQTGHGGGEFIYPRAIDIAPDGTLWVADKTGRIQHLDRQGRSIGGFAMPEIQTGKPVGLSIGPDGNVYVADTHYHRVIVFSPDGRELRRFGRLGNDGGCFIYPTDVAFGPEGRLFISEYGGNDRISVFAAGGEFLRSFGSPGGGPGQFSRPNAILADARRGRLYVADACNHRIAVHGLDGTVRAYVGSEGGDAGQLRYPYGLALMKDGRLIVCEYGNNRLQVFDPDGRSAGIYGGPGRDLGRLAYPWGVAVDDDRRAYVLDSGSNRVQVWLLP